MASGCLPRASYCSDRFGIMAVIVPKPPTSSSASWPTVRCGKRLTIWLQGERVYKTWCRASQTRSIPEDAPKPRPMTPQTILRELSKHSDRRHQIRDDRRTDVSAPTSGATQRRAATNPGRLGPGDTRAAQYRPPFVVKTADSVLQKTQGPAVPTQFLYTKGCAR